MPINEHINPENLDDLLKDAFLDLDPENATDSSMMDEVASSIYSREWPAAQSPAPGSAHAAKLSNIKPWIWILSSFVLVAGLSYAAWAWFGHNTNTSAENETPVSVSEPASQQVPTAATITSGTTSLASLQHEASDPTAVNESGQNQTNATNSVSEMTNTDSRAKDSYLNQTSIYQKNETTNKSTYPTTTAIISIASKGTYTTQNTKTEIPNHDKAEDVHHNNASESSTQTHSTTIINIVDSMSKKSGASLLSPEQTEATKLQVDQMMGGMAGLKFDDYSFIQVDDPAANVKTEFYLKKYEVTIKEYKLFLNDLLAHGKAAEYEIARPKPELVWTDPKDKASKKFLLQYFQKSNYENYPVICVSKEGMEMYCTWIKTEIESYYNRNKNKLSLDVRLPYLSEWKYAASGGKKSHKYGTANGRLKTLDWKTHYIANFAESQQKFKAFDDTTTVISDKQALRSVNKYTFTTPSSENSAIFHLNNMSGNVSEVVVVPGEKDVKTYRTIGGNWNSNKKFLKINAEDEFNGNINPSPFIGFRPVIMINK